MSTNKLNGFGGLASAAGNVLSTGISAIAQHYENKATRAHNLKLAQMQNQWNVEQWERNNDYNSPENQVARLKAAGLNPDLLYGGGVENTSTSSPQMTSGAPRTPTDWSSLANLNPVGSYLDAQLKQAQIDNINADTENKGHEGSILASDAKFRDALNQGTLATQNMSIQLGEVQKQEATQNIKESMARVRSLDASVTESSARIAQIHSQISNDAQRLELEKLITPKQIDKLASECNINNAKANEIVQLLEKSLRQYDDEHELHVENLGTIKVQNGVVKFQAKLHGQDGYDKSLSAFDNCLKFLTRLTDAALASLIKK